jgi:hypothetical protein
MQQNGEAFWHREHQLPNMLICATHNCFLKDPDLNFMEVGKNPVLVPTESICSSSMTPNRDVRISEVANLMRTVLNGDTQVNFNYRQQAVKKGYTRCGFVAQDVLADHFVKYYTEQTLDRFLQSTIRKVPKLRLGNLVNAPGRILNPIKHILLQNFFRNAAPISQQKIYLVGELNSSPYSRTKYYRGTRPVRMPVRNQKSGRDFKEVENRILAQLENQLTKLRTINGNKRISSAYLCRVTNISSSDAQLPRVKAWLIIANESIESFQARRVHKAFLKIRNEGRKLTECNILTRASVWKPSKAILKLVKFLIRTQFEKIPTK